MSQKAEKPTLSGQRIKTRKRDEKEKYDPIGFRDQLFQGLQDQSDVDQILRFLDQAGGKLDYRRYGESLFDILIAGGILGAFVTCSLFHVFSSLHPESYKPCVIFFFVCSAWWEPGPRCRREQARVHQVLSL
jgi:hypothetical protein